MDFPEKLKKMKAEFEEKIPPETLAVMHRATEDLKKSEIMDQFLRKGDKAPAFTLTDHNGKDVSSTSLLEKGPLVINFYRGVWWPYCNAELEALQTVHHEIQDLGAALVVISPQLEKYSKQMATKHKLTYPVLCDRSNAVASQFKLVFELPEELKAIYRTFGIDLERFNGDAAWQLPLPARYLIDRQGLIADHEVNPDYVLRPDPRSLIEKIESL